MGTANLLRKNSALQGDRADSPVVVHRDRQAAMARGAEAVPEKAAARLRVGDNQVVPSNRISGAKDYSVGPVGRLAPLVGENRISIPRDLRTSARRDRLPADIPRDRLPMRGGCRRKDRLQLLPGSRRSRRHRRSKRSLPINPTPQQIGAVTGANPRCHDPAMAALRSPPLRLSRNKCRCNLSLALRFRPPGAHCLCGPGVPPDEGSL
jgi:hypothetical protein